MKGQPVRVLLCVDMEGISQITDFRQTWPDFPECWEAGSAATIADTLATASGLLSGGAKAVTICELHGPARGPVLEAETLPDKVVWASVEDIFQKSGITGAFDALFLLGCHARCGTANGFMSQTYGINVRVAIDGKPVTEAHLNAWRTSLPVIGITGDEALESQIDGGLQGTPFLAVKSAEERATATALFSPEEGLSAIKAFASWCVKNAPQREAMRLPGRFVLSLSMPPPLADLVDGIDDLRRTSPAIGAKSVTDWWYEGEPAVTAALNASFSLLTAPGVDEDLRKEILETWAHTIEAEWLT
jgi:D-amino peptidase